LHYLIVGLVILATGTPVAEVTFPGHDRAADPTGRFEVVYRELPLDSENGPHELSLRNVRNGELTQLLVFGRHASVLWAPDGSALSITDYGGSNFSDISVFLTSGNPVPIDIGVEMSRSFGSVPEREKNDHVYLEAVRWQNARTLRFRLRGYGDHDPGGFERFFDYQLKGQVRRAGKAR
jgi:hypothetical protein